MYVDKPLPKWGYQQTLDKISEPPTNVHISGMPLNQTSIILDYDYLMQWRTMDMFERMETRHEEYGLILIIAGGVIPIALSLLRFVPFPKTLASRFYAIFIDSPLFGARHKVPYFNLALMPTRGQAILIAYQVILNVVLCAVGYHSAQPNAWWYGHVGEEIMTYIGNRTGVLSFANIPLLILYAGRNNFLLWVTDWTTDTFMLLHRWVAYISTLQAILHSILYLKIYIDLGRHASESQYEYWIWGAIGTIAMSVLLPASAIPFRHKLFELFLAWHVILTIFALVGSYLHIVLRYQRQWGYEVWIIMALVIWGFDRIMRVMRMLKNGLRWATITVVDDEYLRVDVEGATGDGHACLYFPTLTWRVWENHPFCISATRLRFANEPASSAGSLQTGSVSGDSKQDVKEADATTAALDKSDCPIGLTFLLRTYAGTTALLRSHARLPVFVESGYLHVPDCSDYESMICIAGGVAITAALPLLRSFPGRPRLYWSSRSAGLVRCVEPELEGTEKNIVVCRRHPIRDIIEDEASRGKGPLAVVVAGPASMADEVRCLVSEISKRSGRAIRLIDLVD